jgi:glucose/arabinose dehydrogenase
MIRIGAALLATTLSVSLAQAQEQQRIKTEKTDVVVDTVARGLEHPWGLTFLPDGRMLVTERPGRLRVVSADGQLSRPIQPGVPVAARGQGGLLDVALDPNFAQNRTIYMSLAEDRGKAAPAPPSFARP